VNDADANTAKPQFQKTRWIGLLPIVVLAWQLGSWALDLYDSFLERLHAVSQLSAECCHEFQAYSAEDSSQRHFWVSVIEQIRAATARNTVELATLSTVVGRLRDDASARPDPFTGSDGQRLQAAIDSLEKRVDALERAQ